MVQPGRRKRSVTDGWLLLPALVFPSACLTSVSFVWGTLLDHYKAGLFFGTQKTFDWKVLYFVIAECALALLVAFLMCVTTNLFYQKRQDAPSFIIGVLIGLPLLNLLQSLMPKTEGVSKVLVGPPLLNLLQFLPLHPHGYYYWYAFWGFVFWVTIASIFVPYFLLSSKVKITFVEPGLKTRRKLDETASRSLDSLTSKYSSPP